ncbi:hypothetical protein DPMN_080615 [Dreissena polymorpha]|uniref:Uncharacterized protein n=1 Tax=Dreissena polymorpha TaxID=45954 RepID=A0A9D3YWR3_DREPO|nr:hypothetical protein DPMN_080615 [Dreissena polymorpha]
MWFNLMHFLLRRGQENLGSMTIQPGKSLYTRSSQNQQKITGLTIRLMIPQEKEISSSSLAVRFIQSDTLRSTYLN